MTTAELVTLVVWARSMSRTPPTPRAQAELMRRCEAGEPQAWAALDTLTQPN